MAKIIINSKLCKGCSLCVEQCPMKIIKIGNEENEKGFLVVAQSENQKCTACKVCAVICPESAIEVYK